MKPFRIFLLASLLLIVFGMNNAEANEYTGNVVITENTGPSLSGTLNNEGDFVEFGYIIDDMEWDYISELRISHIDVSVEWEAGKNSQVKFNVSSQNDNSGQNRTDNDYSGVITILWVVNQLSENISGIADDPDTFVSSFERNGEWMGGKFTFSENKAAVHDGNEYIDYNIFLTYYTWDIIMIPIAIAGLDTSIEPGGTVQFSGAGTDDDGSIVKYEWDFDGDGVYEWSSNENGMTTFIYNNAGTYTAILRVTDNGGNTATDSLSVTVKSPEEEKSGLPSISLLTSLILIGLIARYRRK